MASKPSGNSGTALIQVIAPEDVYKAPRGRKSEINADLVEALTTIPVGATVLVNAFDDAPKGKVRSAVSNKIRAHWKAAFDGRTDNLKISYNLANMPQVERTAE